jgi:PAS domain S-box-containing protein
LEADVKLLTNPLFLRAAIVLVASVSAFLVVILASRLLRRRIVKDGEIPNQTGAEISLPVQAYTVIQQLKQQKFALQNEQQQQRRRTKTSEHITASIIANLPVGMVFIAPTGLVRQANSAARRILGFASPLGMSVADLFRESRAFLASEEELEVREVLQRALVESLHEDDFECDYETPSGAPRELKVTLIPVRGLEGETLGLAAAIADHAEASELRREQLLRAEESAELALELRNSLGTIRDWAEQVRSSGTGPASGLGDDISAEARRLEKVLAKFVAGNERARGAHA